MSCGEVEGGAHAARAGRQRWGTCGEGCVGRVLSGAARVLWRGGGRGARGTGWSAALGHVWRGGGRGARAGRQRWVATESNAEARCWCRSGEYEHHHEGAHRTQACSLRAAQGSGTAAAGHLQRTSVATLLNFHLRGQEGQEAPVQGTTRRPSTCGCSPRVRSGLPPREDESRKSRNSRIWDRSEIQNFTGCFDPFP